MTSQSVLTISIKKIEVVYQPAPGKPYKELTIAVKGQRLQMVDKFTYLGSTLSRVMHIDDEVNARIAKAGAAFGRLRGNVWDRSGIRLDTKLKVYRAVVPSTLLYACETWTVYQRQTTSIQAVLESHNLKMSSFQNGSASLWQGQIYVPMHLYWEKN